MRATASPTLVSWTAVGVAGALAAVLLGEPALVDVPGDVVSV
jgi:hypothetical protein